jgi:protein phosphatase
MTGRTLAIPVPSLVVLVGAAGAGKSTLAGRVFAPEEVLSSDALRAALRGDAADQRATRAAFAILHREARRRLAAGRLVVIDATNVERAARLPLVRLAADARVPAVAIVLLGDRAAVHARNAGRRERIVPRHVVDLHLARLGRLGVDAVAIADGLRIEGFALVHVLADAELATVAIVRSPVVAP